MRKPDHKAASAEVLRLHRLGLTPPEIHRQTGICCNRVWQTLRDRHDEPEGLDCGRTWHVMRENGKRTKEEVREWLQGRNSKHRSGIPGCGAYVFTRLKEWSAE
jgi:hypothetical protein